MQKIQASNPLSAFSASDILSPPTVDRRSLGALVLGQGVLFGATAALCTLFKVNPGMPELSLESIKTALTISAPMIGTKKLLLQSNPLTRVLLHYYLQAVDCFLMPYRRSRFSPSPETHVSTHCACWAEERPLCSRPSSPC
jgi:hypothetical protein